MKQKHGRNRTFEIILITFIILTYIVTFVCVLTDLRMYAFISYICQAVAVFLLLYVFHARTIPVQAEEEALSFQNEDLKQLTEEHLQQIRELKDTVATHRLQIEQLQSELQDAHAKLEEQIEAYTELQEETKTTDGLQASASAGSYADFLPPIQESEETTVDILQIVRDTMDELKVSADAAHIQLQLASASTSLYVKAAPSRIRILFRNIIDNSIKYMQRTGILLITISNIGSDIFVVLKDNGMGLSSDETNHIFELNYQGSNRISGNGLGLTQAKAIVDYYGGTIYAKSTPSQGMGIYIQLPTD
ncbi:MAG: HAMP domain-containing sensor histidine kinase [Clostridium sp.]|nr:HAMP domain-containing sensor histidine kinase [Clostridium sp.]